MDKIAYSSAFIRRQSHTWITYTSLGSRRVKEKKQKKNRLDHVYVGLFPLYFTIQKISKTISHEREPVENYVSLGAQTLESFIFEENTEY